MADRLLERPKSGGAPQVRADTRAASLFAADATEAFVLTGGKLVAFGP